jgi:hypothetical protein
MAHVIKIGKIHALTAGFGQVNTNDNQSCVKGLHLGGHYCVKSYSGTLVDCLVVPEDIGLFVMLKEDGAIRCRRYMVTRSLAVSKVCTTIILRKCWMQSGLSKSKGNC